MGSDISTRKGEGDAFEQRGEDHEYEHDGKNQGQDELFFLLFREELALSLLGVVAVGEIQRIHDLFYERKPHLVGTEVLPVDVRGVPLIFAN
ncbi:MAG: hypothetical protein P8181_16445, partial [bacterium]